MHTTGVHNKMNIEHFGNRLYVKALNDFDFNTFNNEAEAVAVLKQYYKQELPTLCFYALLKKRRTLTQLQTQYENFESSLSELTTITACQNAWQAIKNYLQGV